MKSLDELRLDDFRLNLKGRSLVPVMQGGMGVNISTAEMAQAVAARGGIGHVSDAMIPDLADRLFGTGFTRMKTIACKKIEKTMGQAGFLFPVDKIREAAKLYLGSVMEGKKGEGLIHVNVMEKLTMNSGLETLKARLFGALDAGIDGISLSAGLHTSSFALMSEHPRFRDACLGVVVSSRRALNLFLRKSAKTERLPDYIVVEGPLAGGHLGFGMDWANFSLPDIVRDVKAYLAENKLSIPVLAAGGVFTGTDGVRMMQEAGADGIQAATRFAVTKESGLPDDVKQQYFNARAEDIEVNGISPTGYPMRMLKSSPAINAALKPQCAAYGYMLDHGGCAYLKAWREAEAAGTAQDGIREKTCLCAQMRSSRVWTLGANGARLAEAGKRDASGRWVLPSTAEVFDDYRFGVADEVHARRDGCGSLGRAERADKRRADVSLRA